jgi:hypothetical protein
VPENRLAVSEQHGAQVDEVADLLREHLRSLGDHRSAEAVADEDGGLRQVAHRSRHRVDVVPERNPGGGSGVRAVGGQVGTYDGVPSSGKLTADFLPDPAPVPGSVNQNEHAHGALLAGRRLPGGTIGES